MIKRYIKQTWAMLRQHKLFGALYILGTAIPIAMTMIVITFQYIRVGSIYPEEHRDELWCSEWASCFWGGSHISLNVVKNWFYPLRDAQAVTAITSNYGVNVLLADGKHLFKVKNTLTDTGFFRVFDFDFLAGKSFTESDFVNGNHCAVISASLSRRLFGTEQSVGRSFQMNYVRFSVSGVVRDASSLTPLSYAEVYVPYSCFPERDASTPDNLMGPYMVCMRIPKGKASLVQTEIKERIRQYQLMYQQKGQVDIPRPIWQYNISDDGHFGIDDDMVNKALYIWGGLILIFLFVPALNLSGMISGRMEERLTEMGIYKTFGATRQYLLQKVLMENLAMTLLGGLLGLLFSWSVLLLGKGWVFGFLFPGFYLKSTADILITPEMLFSPWIFLSAFLVCLILNVASALLPVWNALRVEIVYSLNQKK